VLGHRPPSSHPAHADRGPRTLLARGLRRERAFRSRPRAPSGGSRGAKRDLSSGQALKRRRAEELARTFRAVANFLVSGVLFVRGLRRGAPADGSARGSETGVSGPARRRQRRPGGATFGRPATASRPTPGRRPPRDEKPSICGDFSSCEHEERSLRAPPTPIPLLLAAAVGGRRAPRERPRMAPPSPTPSTATRRTRPPPRTARRPAGPAPRRGRRTGGRCPSCRRPA
jgi:hypothetical protein